jgi:hypothetical protein
MLLAYTNAAAWGQVDVTSPEFLAMCEEMQLAERDFPEQEQCQPLERGLQHVDAHSGADHQGMGGGVVEQRAEWPEHLGGTERLAHPAGTAYGVPGGEGGEELLGLAGAEVGVDPDQRLLGCEGVHLAGGCADPGGGALADPVDLAQPVRVVEDVGDGRVAAVGKQVDPQSFGGDPFEFGHRRLGQLGRDQGCADRLGRFAHRRDVRGLGRHRRVDVGQRTGQLTENRVVQDGAADVGAQPQPDPIVDQVVPGEVVLDGALGDGRRPSDQDLCHAVLSTPGPEVAQVGASLGCASLALVAGDEPPPRSEGPDLVQRLHGAGGEPLQETAFVGREFGEGGACRQ